MTPLSLSATRPGINYLPLAMFLGVLMLVATGIAAQTHRRGRSVVVAA